MLMTDEGIKIIGSRTAKYPKSVVQAQLNELLGKEVWFRTSIKDVNSGIMISVKGMGHATIKTESGKITVHADNIYLTKEDLLGANYALFNARVDAYCKKICTVEDLVKFCYSHHTSKCGECSDYEARVAARKRAVELLGIDIDPEATAREKELKEDLEEPDED